MLPKLALLDCQKYYDYDYDYDYDDDDDDDDDGDDDDDDVIIFAVVFYDFTTKGVDPNIP